MDEPVWYLALSSKKRPININPNSITGSLKKQGKPVLGNNKDRRLVVYALVTPRATKESISGRFLMNDLNPLMIIPLPGNNNANVANEAWKNILPNIGEFIYLPSARWPKPENNKSNRAKVSFFHWLFHFFFFLILIY